jgi:hypothetical protein
LIGDDVRYQLVLDVTGVYGINLTLAFDLFSTFHQNKMILCGIQMFLNLGPVLGWEALMKAFGIVGSDFDVT